MRASFGPAYDQTTEGQSVGAAIERVASPLAGRIGFAAQEIGGDEVIAFNGDQTFAMASTYKVAIAAAILDRVDRGELSLDQMVDIDPDTMVIGQVGLAETFPHPGLQLSSANLIEGVSERASRSRLALTTPGRSRALTRTSESPSRGW